MADNRWTIGRLPVSAAFPALALAIASSALAQQPVPAVSQAVVQPVPGRDGLSLNAALARLARNPRDGEALIDAGRAALAMGDVDAAIGFYRRADEVLPGNPRVKAGLAGALVRNENPFDAIPLFAEAERGGLADAAVAADRGLAYDLVGDNETAQRHYRLALARESSDEVVRRLALSQAIAGDRKSAETTLAPLVARQDKAALRTRAFALAILGQTDDAVGIAYASLPQDLAAAISPYLRYMPRLTPAQQAAAANFGHFPRASEIGRDDPRVAQFAPPGARRPVTVASADAALIPRGEPLGRSARNRNARAAQREAPSRAAAPATPAPRAAPPEVQPSRASLPSPTASVLVSAAPPPLDLPATPPRRQEPAAAAARPAEAPVGELPPLAPATTTPPVEARATAAAATGPVAPPAMPGPSGGPAVPSRPGFATLENVGPATPPAQVPPVQVPAGPATTPSPAATLAAALPPAPAVPAASVPVSQPAAAPPSPPAVAAPPPRPRSLAEAFADLAAAPAEVAPAPGAVDIRRITPAREAPRAEEAKPAAKPVKPPPPSHPSRIWVQVATGRDKDALAFDWRRMTRGAADTFRGKSPFVSNWGRTNRLLTGPFPSEAAANQFIAQLRKADIDGAFLWTSPAGQVVDALPGR